jgi:2-polyprenyl-3-methyl-5-hydroxy-6-metoxy-1,4-benzoquinol methylase
MSHPLYERLLACFTEKHPQFLRGLAEAEAVQPARFRPHVEEFLRWAVAAYAEGIIAQAAASFVHFTTDVNLAQARYEKSGSYECRTYAEVYASHYSSAEQMHGYLWGIYLSNWLWAHHADLSYFYLDRFLTRVRPGAHFVEIAPGHGGWGILALHRVQDATIEGYDISPSSIEIATKLAHGAGLAGRAIYEERDALSLGSLTPQSADACICSFVLEHLEEPEAIFRAIAHLLKPGGTAFVTGALTAAQVDHIFEFHRESELVLMAEKYGLRVTETLSANPARLLPRARFVPRSMALIVRR